jgi:cytoskeletal protein CcmA (bactofilin family)
MNVLARINNGSNQPIATDPVGEPPSALHRPQPHTLGSPRAYAGPSIISTALSVVGRLESAGDIQIDGKVDGDIRGQGIRIGNTATIKGTVHGELVELSGTLEGKIEARSVVLTRTARMSGDIVHQSLQIEEGAYFNGNSRPSYGK